MADNSIIFPTDVNGLTEVGIAAGSDEYTSTDGKIHVYWKSKAGAPVRPSASEIRAANLVSEWAAFIDVDDPPASRIALFNNDADITGPVALGAIIDEVKAAFTNWPVDQDAAGNLETLLAEDAVERVNAWDAWISTEASCRRHVEIDYDKTFMNNNPIGNSTVAKKLWQGMLLVALKKGWVIKRGAAGNGLLTHVGPETVSVAVRDAAAVMQVGFATAQISANTIVGSKVAWWLINHHVGQNESSIESYAGKVVKSAQLVSDGNVAELREVRKVVWAIGKIISTRGILRALGINSIVYGDASNTGDVAGNDYAIGGQLTINISADVRDRIKANPAGTAGLSTYYAIVKNARGSIFSCCIPPLTSLGYDKAQKVFTGPVQDMMDAIATTPARYHMGSMFLTGLARLPSEVWSDEEKQNLAAYIHATSPNGTLAKAPVILKRTDIVGTPVHQAIMSAKLNLTMGTGNLITNMLIQRVSTGATTGGLGGQLGTIAQDDLDEVAEAASAWESGEVSEDEEAEGRETAVVRSARIARNTARAERRLAYRKAVALIPESIRNPRPSTVGAGTGATGRAVP